jgi:hypothetical protein
MVMIQNEEKIEIDNNLFILTNLLCNYFFILTTGLIKLEVEKKLNMKLKVI